MDKIPFVDLRAQAREVQAEVQAGWRAVNDHTGFILGPEVEAFESAYANFCCIQHCIGVASGSDALVLALKSLDIGPGHRVVLPANTFTATAMAVHHVGATPVLVDCDDDYLIDLEQVAAFGSPEIQAVLPVHLFGQMVPMEPLSQLAHTHGWHLIEDAAQSHGATQAGLVGAVGEVVATSFYPGKNLGAHGDAGAVLTNNHELAQRLRRLRNHGGQEKYEHREVGFNSRLDTIQAVVLSAKLKRLERWNAQRREAAAYYLDLLSDLRVGLPQTRCGNVHVWHLFVVRVPADRRDDILQSLRAAGIEAGIHYPVPIHLQPAFVELGYRAGQFPVAERAAREMISLPLFPHITRSQQDRVVEELARALER